MKATKIQMTFSTIQDILDKAREAKKLNKHLSNCIEIELLEECDTHNGNDRIIAAVKSGYQDGDSLNIYLTGFQD